MGSKAVVKLPVLISVPHGGTKVPKEVKGFCKLSIVDILRDGDTWSRELYGLKEQVALYLDTEVARAVVDLNRHPDDRAPINPDGVTKTVTVDGVQVWGSPTGLNEKVSNYLIATYHSPYHRALKEMVAGKEAIVALDCHTMLGIGPENSVDQGKARPLVCISNRGGNLGQAKGETITAPSELVQSFAKALSKAFEHQDMEVQTDLVDINNPFKGGYITKAHGGLGKLPWIQVEISRQLYISADTIIEEKPSYKVQAKLSDLRAKFASAVKDIV
ncbi:formiminoglutamase [Desulfitispora alkaliphila]|uniref:N-formylglutamate amidohydrolase n=1 Tax=Desulfitispora alkaliphila TaxID=622674 RepID=UPI003D1FBE05